MLEQNGLQVQYLPDAPEGVPRLSIQPLGDPNSTMRGGELKINGQTVKMLVPPGIGEVLQGRNVFTPSIKDAALAAGIKEPFSLDNNSEFAEFAKGYQPPAKEIEQCVADKAAELLADVKRRIAGVFAPQKSEE